MNHPPEALTTIDEKGRRKWVYPASVSGPFRKWRRGLGYFVILIYFVMPWIKIGGMQSILLQIPERRFVLFGQIFWPQELLYLVFLLLGLTAALFFFTALVGRVWCGWLCPQTVFLEEVFRKIEEWVEGDHHERMRLDKGPWNFRKVWKKGLKHSLYLIVSAHVSNTFIAYFVGTEELMSWTAGSPLDHWTAFLFMFSILAVFYFDFAWFREQFCIVLCPYARFQSVLTDEHTIQVGYDQVRGEPRGHVGQTTGDCIDCYRCVAVCPTGIDIRDGYQLACIGCARCIDACNEIMDRVQRPHGLVRHDSLTRFSGERTEIFRPRILVYSVLLVGVLIALFVGLGTRPLLDLTVVRPPGRPFTILSDHLASNHFSLRFYNRSQEDKTYRLAIEGPAGLKLVTPFNPIEVKAGQERRTEAFVTVPISSLHEGKARLRILVYHHRLLIAEKSITLLGPQVP